MTTLTPHRQALEGALDAAHRDLPPYDPANLEVMTRHMTLDLQRAMLLPVADMLDHRVAAPDVCHVIANSLSNAVLSHAMSRFGGDRDGAAREAAELMLRVSAILEASFDIPDLDAYVVSSSEIQPTGRAQ
ncbi:hypothetical protein MMSR116_29400 [Methylobacterium mesophilicum SR1.6/6]|uniref:Uncharacterized protein n=1 Tax=Methylobacterium mesophilicum SR1.6/6 TaxID=908290 RepID=A0A6B9FS93_9HYPH|nr:hypothetical protein [Methylobacterium mesophilicum]QGY05553.1 hypothetical protein MMSR116_29400 [Methylobacterium mesophilicum SR1.6/6]